MQIKSTQQVVSKYSISVMPEKTIEAELRKIPLDKIKLDPKNVRFRHLFSTSSDEEMEAKIWKMSSTQRLYGEIKFAQGLVEKPLVQPVENHYVVREGNVRIVCLRKLKNEIIDEKENIPIEKIDPQLCIVLPKDVTETEIAIYLTRAHVGLRTPWATFNKAGQIYDLYTTHGLTYDTIAKSCGVGKATAMRMVTTYKALRDYLEKYPDDKRIDRFSYFYEFYKLESKMKKIGKPNWVNDNLHRFMEWLHNDQFDYGKQVRLIPQVMADPAASQVLLGGKEMSKAIEVLEAFDPTVGSILYKRLGKLSETLDKFSYEEMASAAEIESKLRFLKELRKKVDALIANIESIQRTKIERKKPAIRARPKKLR